jgi:WD40 repeat protein
VGCAAQTACVICLAGGSPPKGTEPPAGGAAPVQRWEEEGFVYAIAFSPDGKTLVSSSGNRVRLREAATGKELRVFAGHGAEVSAVALSPDGKTAASGGWDKTVRLWEAATGKELHTLAAHEGRVRSLAFSPDGRTLASAGDDRTIRLWAVAAGKAGRVLAGVRAEVEAVAFSPDGHYLASVDGTATRLWDPGTGKEIRNWSRVTARPGDTPPLVHSVAFSPDGRRLAAGIGNFVRVWDVGTGRGVATLQGHPPLVVINGLAFSPDGKTLASGSGMSSSMDHGEQKCLRLWDVASGKELFALDGHPDGIYSLAFSPDGKQLASAGHKGVVIWKVWE